MGRGGPLATGVRAIHEARDGTLWIGTNTGLVRRSPDGRERVFTTKDGLPSDRILSIIETEGRHALGELPQRRPGAHRGRPADADHRDSTG